MTCVIVTCDLLIMKKKVLITGVNGFIGRAMWQYLRKYKKSVDVYGIARTKQPDYTQIAFLDLLNSKRLGKYLDDLKPDYIFHLAGGRMNDHAGLIRSNVETTKSLLSTIKLIGQYPTNVVIPGSAAEYGLPSKNVRRIHERYPAQPLSDYGKVKLQQTELALKYAAQGIPVTVARIFNITGANTPEQLAAGRFAKQIVTLEKGNRKGMLKTMSLKGRRDFLDMDDICSALWHLAESGRPGHIYNVCSSVPVKIEDLLFKLILLSKLTDVEILEDESSGSKSFDVIGSNAKIKSHTSWKPVVSLDESLTSTLKSWRKTLSGER